MYEIKYRAGDELSNTNIDWLPLIPLLWNVSRNKYLFYKNKTIVGRNAENYKVLSLTMQGVIPRDIGSNMGKMPKEWGQYQLVKKDELLLCLFDIDVTPRTVGYVEEVGIVSPAYSRYLKISNDLEMKYFYYWYLSLDMSKSLLHLSKNLRSSISSTEFSWLEVCKPPQIEQLKIVNFLDIKTAQFDYIIAKKEQLIKKLEEAKKSLISEVVTGKVKIVGGKLVPREAAEMKDSGVEWLGMVPQSWDVKKIKYLSQMISKGTTPSTVGREILDEGVVRFIKAENIVNNQLAEYPEFYIDDKTNKILCRSTLRENDLLFVIAGATIGKVAIVGRNMCPANTNQAISFIRLNSPEYVDFLYYWLQSSVLHKHMWMLAVQAAQPNLSMENLGNFAVLFPNNQERNLIVEYLNKSIEEIDLLLQLTKTQISKQMEAKQSLISEAVTGKIDLRDWEIIEEGELQ